MFRKYLSALPLAPLTEAVAAAYGVILEASEGEAGKYFRKTIRAASPDIVRHLHDDVVAVMRQDKPSEPEEHWVEWLWNWFRQDFALRNSEAVYFAPGLARIVLCQPDSDQTFEYYPLDAMSRNATLMKDIVHYITMAHKDDYTRYLVDKRTGQPATFDNLVEKFGAALKKHGEEVMANLEKMEYTPSDYVIVELENFEIANEFAEYTELEDGSRWCYLDDEGTYDYYRQDGVIRCYLAYKPGYQRLRPGDKGYGQSMLGIDIGPGNVLVHCNNRYNHDNDPELDNEANPPGDDRFNSQELSQLLGGPYYKFCPYYTEEERKKLHIYTGEDIEEALANGESIDGLVGKEFHMENGDQCISLHDQYNILTSDNRLLLRNWVDNIRPIRFKGTYHYLVEFRDKSNILDLGGHPVLDKWYDKIYIKQTTLGFGDKSATFEVRDGDLRNLMDDNGNLVFKNWYRFVPVQLSDNIYAAFMSDHKVHFINKDEKQLTDFTPDHLQPINDEYSLVVVNDKYNAIRNRELKPMLDPWFDKREAIVPADSHIDQVMANSETRGKVYNLIDHNAPTHYLLDQWCDGISREDHNLLRVMYYDSEARDTRYNLFNPYTQKFIYKENAGRLSVGKENIRFDRADSDYTQLTDLEGNPLFNDWVNNFDKDKKREGYWLTKDGKKNYSRQDKTLALEQWYDDVWHGIGDEDYVVAVKNDDGTKMNVLRNGKPLFEQWPDNISIKVWDDPYYLLKYGDLYTVSDSNGNLLLDQLYGGIECIYDGGRILVTAPNSANTKARYTICKDGKPMLDGWFEHDTGSWWTLTGANSIAVWDSCTVVQIDHKYNILLNSGKWLFDQWYDWIMPRYAPSMYFLVKSNGKYNILNYDHFEFDHWFKYANWRYAYSTDTALSDGDETIVVRNGPGGPGAPMDIQKHPVTEQEMKEYTR